MNSAHVAHPTDELARRRRRRNTIDCAGARLRVTARSLATVLSLEGDIDLTNAGRLVTAVQRFAKLGVPLVVDCSRTEFIGLAGFRALLVLDQDFHRCGLQWCVVSGAAMRPLLRVSANHGLPLAESIPEALRYIEEDAGERHSRLADLVRQHDATGK